MDGTKPFAGPQETATPFDPLYTRVTEIRQFIPLLRKFMDVDECIEIADQVVELPPEERFTESHDLVKEQIRDNLRIIEVLSPSTRQELGKSLAKIGISSFEKEIHGIQLETFQQAVQYENTDYIVFGMFLETLHTTATYLDEYINERETLEPIFACYVALISRLVVLQQREQREVDEDIIYDIAYCEYYLSKALGRPIDDHPENREFQEIREDIVKRGALRSYSMIDISVGLAAELAGVSQDEFHDLLGDYGIPRRIPDQLHRKSNALAVAVGRDGADVINDAIEEYIEDRAKNEDVQQQIADAYYEDELTFEQVEELVGPDEAGNFKVLKEQLEDESLRNDLATVNDSSC